MRLHRLRAAAAVAKTPLVAGTTLAIIFAACLGVQIATFGRPSAATLELVRTLRHLSEYHRSQAVIVLDGRRATVQCGERWHGRARVAAAVVNGSRVLTEVNNHLLTKGAFAQTEFELSGCPRSLATWLSSQLEQGAAVSIKRTRDDGLPVIELHLPAARPPLDVYVLPRTQLPVELLIAGRHLNGRSDVSFGRGR